MLVIVIILGVLAVAGWVLSAVQRRRYVKKFNKFAKEGAALVEEIEKLRKSNAHYLKFSEDVLQERDRAMKLYQLFGHQTSAAQTWLLREVRRLQGELNVYRRKEGLPPAEIDPGLCQLVEEYPESIERTVAEVPPAQHPDKDAGSGKNTAQP